MPDSVDIEAGKFAVGQPVPRSEDPVLLTGTGAYTDDFSVAGQAHAVMVRSDVPHGTIRTIDTADAVAASRVLAVLTADDLAADGVGTLPCLLPLKSRDGSDLLRPPRPVLATGKVRHIGEPLACVIAESEAAALDGAERVVADIEPLPVVGDVEAAVAPGAPQLHDEVPGNVALDHQSGAEPAAVDAAFAAADHITRLRIVNNRVAISALEPRAAVAEYDGASERFTLHVGCQGVLGMRNMTANHVMKIEPEKLHIIAGNIGGSFGMKAMPYPEYICLLVAARRLGRPVKWAATRAESFVSDHQGRAALYDATLALDANGNFLAVRVEGYGDMGGYLTGTGPLPQSQNIRKNTSSVYATPLLDVQMKCVFTNTVPVGAYRGAGRPEGNYIMERLVDAAARETGRDPVELRRQNLIAPGAFPFASASGETYDGGDFAAILDEALALADHAGHAPRRAASAAAGKRRGVGVACYLECTAPPGKENGAIRFNDDGTGTLITGTLDYGQGHATPFAQVLAERLGLPFAAIRLLQGDSDALLVGGGTGGSRSMIASGGAIVEASEAVIERGRLLAGHVLEASAADIEFRRPDGVGAFAVVGTDRAISLMDLAARARALDALPEGVPDSLDVALVHDTGPSSYPNGCHVCEVEVDPETGAVTVDRYVVVDDFGVIVNPLMVEGQVHGGIVQGIGQVLQEEIVYADDGQILSGTYMDYTLPRAREVPDMVFASHPVPATTNVLGVKGCGEAGTTGAMPAVMNALINALADDGVTDLDMPATPQRVWAAINGGA